MMECIHCEHSFSLQDKEVRTWWNDSGTSSAKICECPKCKKLNIIKYEFYWTEDINNDERLF